MSATHLLAVPFNVVIVARRPATAEDYEFARMVHHAAFRDVVERQFGPWDEAFQDQAFDREWHGSATEIVEWEGRPCGYVVVENRDQDLHVRQLVIHPQDQNKGVGSAVLREVTALAESRNVPVHLGVFVASRAVALYLRLGFEEVGRSASHVIMRWTPRRPARRL